MEEVGMHRARVQTTNHSRTVGSSKLDPPKNSEAKQQSFGLSFQKRAPQASYKSPREKVEIKDMSKDLSYLRSQLNQIVRQADELHLRKEKKDDLLDSKTATTSVVSSKVPIAQENMPELNLERTNESDTGFRAYSDRMDPKAALSKASIPIYKFDEEIPTQNWIQCAQNKPQREHTKSFESQKILNGKHQYPVQPQKGKEWSDAFDNNVKKQSLNFSAQEISLNKPNRSNENTYAFLKGKDKEALLGENLPKKVAHLNNPNKRLSTTGHLEETVARTDYRKLATATSQLKLHEAKIELEYKIGKLEFENGNLKFENNSLTTELSHQRKSFEDLRKKMHDIQQKEKQTRCEMELLNLDYDLLKNKKQKMPAAPVKFQNFNDSLKSHLEEIDFLKGVIEEKDEEINRTHELVTIANKKVDQIANELKIQKLKAMTQSRQQEQKFEIQIHDCKNEIKTLKNALQTMQGKLEVAINENASKDDFMKQHLLGRVNQQSDKEYVHSVLEKVPFELKGNTLVEKLLEEQRQIAFLKKLLLDK